MVDFPGFCTDISHVREDITPRKMRAELPSYNRIWMAVNLEQIVAGARRTAARPKSQSHLAEMGRRAAHHLPRGFASALRDESKSGPAVIAELKKASP